MGGERAVTRRSNEEWLSALGGGGDEQAAALVELRTYLLRAALYALQRARHLVGHLGPSALAQLAEDCAQEALTAVLQRLGTFRGDSHFTTWAYTFAVNIALTAARRERWSAVDLDAIHEGGASASSDAGHEGHFPDPERRAMQMEMMAAIRDGIDRHLTIKQREALRAVVLEGVPLDEVVRRWGSSRNAVYKLVHDARRKLRAHLTARGFDVEEILDLYAA